jgi:uncharacterized protein YodC (DUF2158 family)
MDEQLKPGDVVRLKSGGPEMTIEEIGDYSWGSGRMQARCKWFEGKALKESTFELASLLKISG